MHSDLFVNQIAALPHASLYRGAQKPHLEGDFTRTWLVAFQGNQKTWSFHGCEAGLFEPQVHAAFPQLRLLVRSKGLRLHEENPFRLNLSRLQDVVFHLLCAFERE